MELGLCDVDTFITAREFCQYVSLVGVIEDYCKKNQKNFSKIKESVTVLALYKVKTWIEILSF